MNTIKNYTDEKLRAEMDKARYGRNWLIIRYGGYRGNYSIDVVDVSIHSIGQCNWCDTIKSKLVPFKNKKKVAEVITELKEKYNCEMIFFVNTFNYNYEDLDAYYKLPKKIMAAHNIIITTKLGYDNAEEFTIETDRQYWLELCAEWKIRREHAA